MVWIAGIDEAGYGPNLGPFVMAAVLCRAPETCDLWRRLRTTVRRASQPADGRLLIEDSKAVYSSSKGLKELERGVAAIFSPKDDASMTDWMDALAPGSAQALDEECWYTGATQTPVAADRDDVRHSRDRFAQCADEAGVADVAARAVVVCPPRFNGLIERGGTKGMVLLTAVAELLRWQIDARTSAEPMHVTIDKHGGRNTYASLLEQVIPEAGVHTEIESAERSTYRLDGLAAEVHVTFQPRADADHFCTALASMLAKYLRELLMSEFNAFWQSRLPDLKPTAGYPVDARRFWEAIESTVQEMGLTKDQLWRRK